MYSTRLPCSLYCQRAELCYLNDYSPSFVGTQLEIMHRSCIQSLDLCSSTAVAHTRADHTEITNTTLHVLGRIWMAGPWLLGHIVLVPRKSDRNVHSLCIPWGLGEWPPALEPTDLRVAAAERSRRLDEAMVVTSSDWDWAALMCFSPTTHVKGDWNLGWQCKTMYPLTVVMSWLVLVPSWNCF